VHIYKRIRRMNTENKPAWPQGYNPKGKRRSKAEVRAHNLQVWLTDETLKARIVSAAKADGRTMANWINSKICPIIDAVVDAALAGKNLNDAKVAELFIKNATEAQRAKKLMGADRNAMAGTSPRSFNRSPPRLRRGRWRKRRGGFGQRNGRSKVKLPGVVPCGRAGRAMPQGRLRGIEPAHARHGRAEQPAHGMNRVAHLHAEGFKPLG